MSEPYVGEIRMVGFNFAPRGWALANGQLLAISSNDALFSLYGTIYGGDGRTTFGLPQINSRVPIHPGQGPGLPTYRLGQRGGEERVTITSSTLATHPHTAELKANTNTATETDPSGHTLADTPFPMYGTPPSTAAPMHANTVSLTNTGGSQPHENRQPYLAINFCVALFGVYPSRN
jgi:microcystin-dependent protein